VKDDNADAHLSQMTTIWTMVYQARSGKPDQVGEAISRLMLQYAGAVHRYLLKILRNPEIAAELDQEFALRFIRGDFRNCDPSRGRFRDYVKRALQNLVNDYYRRQRPNVSMDALFYEPLAEDTDPPQFEVEFIESWKKDLLERAWRLLLELEEKSGLPYYTVLRLRVDHPDLRSQKLAERLSSVLGRTITAGAFRQSVQRARAKYVNFLIGEVKASLQDPTAENVEEELGDLGLLEFCRSYLKQAEESPGSTPGPKRS
jgi:RNA polymerase sigma-70 factor (ECF subfamily)